MENLFIGCSECVECSSLLERVMFDETRGVFAYINSDKEAIVTIGIKPSRPETGYGYIATADLTDVDEIYKVEAFP